MMQIEETALPGVLVLTPTSFSARGFFNKSWNGKALESKGIGLYSVQVRCGIDWGLAGAPVLSAKDAAAVPFDSFESPFTWEGAA